MHRSDISRVPLQRKAAALGTLQVGMIADLVCPWCYLGKRRLDAALHAVLGPTETRWLPFQLNPDMPAGGMGFEDYLAKKFGDPAKVQPGLDELTQAGAAEGIRFRFDLVKCVPNTLDAHRLMQLAESEGASTPGVAEGLFSSFFEEGLDIANRDLLVEVAGNHGIGASAVHAALEDDKTRQRVLDQEAEVRRGGVTGVPDFLINDRLFVIGAQPKQVLVDAFDRAMFGEESDLPVSDSLH